MSADTAAKPSEVSKANIASNVMVNSPRGRAKLAKTPSSPCVLPILEGRMSKGDEKSLATVGAATEDVSTSDRTFITGGNDFIPADILNSLTKIPTPPSREQLGPPNKYKRLGPIESANQARRRPANVWNYSKARDKFKHLTEQPPCLCGAGRDISFLYDAVATQEKEKLSKVDDKKGGVVDTVSRDGKDRTALAKIEKFVEETDKAVAEVDTSDSVVKTEAVLIPHTLLPSEYHIVKNPGVMGLEFHDDKYSTYIQEHEDHLTVFPSMVPSGRQEVMKLKHSMDAMLSRAGVDDEGKELAGPTQIHNLLELVKKEQNIYNICFNEIIRQVTIDCAERGELLANLRKRYGDLLDKIPRQVKSLHQEVVAQRALDRRLTEELVRFKSSISTLTSELATVRTHDREVTQQAIEAKNELRAALEESEKNASLLAEYHDLYELQRKRLEAQVGKLTEERDLWGSATYTLALKVTEKHSLNTAKKLHLCEKAWSKLARHFAIFLSDKDSIQLESLTNHVQTWRDLVEKFNKGIEKSEEEMRKKLQSLVSKLNRWKKEFQKILNYDDGSVRRPNKNVITSLYADLKHLEEVFNQEAERFTGETLLSREDELYRMNKQVDNWTDVALKVFNRHQTSDGQRWPQHQVMQRLNGEVDKLHQQYHVRVVGENGVAKGIIDLVNPIETWSNKLNAVLHGGDMIADSEWFRLGDLLCTEWPDDLAIVIDLIGSTLKEGARAAGDVEDSVDVEHLIKDTMKWLSATTNGIDSEDGKIVERVSIIHSTMIRWMVTVLLRLTPDMEDETLKGIDTDDGESSIGGGEILLQSTSEEIFNRAERLFEVLRSFSGQLTKCCSDLVVDLMQERRDKGDELADMDFKELKRLRVEGEGWIRTAELLRLEVVGEDFVIEQKPPETGKEVKKESHDFLDVSAATSTEPSEDGQKMSDANRPQTTESKPPSVSPQKDEPQQPADDEPRKTETVELSSPEIVTEQADEETAEDGGQEENKETGTEQDEAREEVDEDRMRVLGHDENIRTQLLENIPSDQEAEFLMVPEGDAVPARSPTPDTKKALEALAAVERLQTQLLETEERAQVAEERAIQAETELKQALEKIRAFERSASRLSSSTHSAAERPASGASKIAKSPASPSHSPSRATSRSSTRTSTRKK